MTQFKVGDKVRRIITDFAGLKRGDIGTVSYVEGSGLRLEGYTPMFATDKFELVEESKRHPFADIICAWANGVKVQFRIYDSVDEVWTEWKDTDTPTWNGYGYKVEYRVKPEPKPDVVKYMSCWETNPGVYTSKPSPTKQEVGGQISLTFDGTTGKLKAVELIGEKK